MNSKRASWMMVIALALLATGCAGAVDAATVQEMGSGGAPAVAVDLLALAPAAAWQSGQLLPDGGIGQTTPLAWIKDSDFAGYAGVDSYTLEDGGTRPALHLHPQWVEHGTISGRFPWLLLPPGAAFEADLGFLAGAVNSDGVTFLLYESHYDANGGIVRTQLAQVFKPYDGRLAPLRVDLAHLAGKIVALEVRIDAGATSMQDWAILTGPRINGW